jgi:transposase
MAAQGLDNDELAARLDTRREVVSLWRKRFFEERWAGLDDKVRPGRPRVFRRELAVEIEARQWRHR